jgi:hypothetical protein
MWLEKDLPPLKGMKDAGANGDIPNEKHVGKDKLPLLIGLALHCVTRHANIRQKEHHGHARAYGRGASGTVPGAKGGSVKQACSCTEQQQGCGQQRSLCPNKHACRKCN